MHPGRGELNFYIGNCNCDPRSELSFASYLYQNESVSNAVDFKSDTFQVEGFSFFVLGKDYFFKTKELGGIFYSIFSLLVLLP